MCRGHQRQAECVQTSDERGEDTAVMARLESACGQGRLPRRPGARHSRSHIGHRSRPRCCHIIIIIIIIIFYTPGSIDPRG